MSRKVKCKMCEKSMRWALPERVTENNYEYAKHCLRMVKNTLVCDRTMRTKYIEHEQYCKYFRIAHEVYESFYRNLPVSKYNQTEQTYGPNELHGVAIIIG